MSTTRTLLLCAALLTAAQIRSALAQAVEAATQPATVPALTEPALAATEPATAPATSTAPATMPTTLAAPATLRAGASLSMNFKDATIDSVLDHLSEAASFIVVKTTPVEGRVTIFAKQPVTPAEAVILLNTALKSAGTGYTAIQQDRILKIIPLDKAKKSNIPVHFGAEPEQIAKTDEVITQVVPIGSIDALKLRADLTPLINSDADVTANAGSNSIIITDSSANIRRLVEIIAALDHHRTAVADILVRQLNYASATAAAKLITDIFQPPQNTGGPGAGGGGGGIFGRIMFGRGGPGGGGPGGGGPGGSDASAAGAGGDPLNSRVLASSDDRTNTLVVSGPTETLKVIDRVITQLDANPAEGQTTFIYNLKNADATNLQGVLNTLFGTGSGTSSSLNRNTSTSNTTASPFGSSGFGSTSGGSRTGSSGSMGSRTGSSGFGSSGSSGSSGFGSTGTSSTARPVGGGTLGGLGSSSLSATSSRAATDLTGQVFVVAEPDTNALLVTTNAKYVDRVKAILDELDRAVPQVLIKVLIAEVTHNNTDDIGVEYSILNTRPSGNGQSGGSNFNIGTAISSAVGGAGPGGLVFSLAEDNATAALRALASTNKVDVLSRPYILGSDNQLASIMSGQVVPYISASNIVSTGDIINTVAYQNIGIILNVTPHINPDGLVILDVNPQISTLATSTVTVQQGVTAPIFNLRQAQSRVAIKSGQTIIIGGLMQDETTEQVDKIPLLGDIPLLGALFRHSVTTKQKTELLIFLTPHVAQQPDVLKGMTQQEREGTKLTPNAVGPGVFDEHMRGMGLGATTIPATRPAILPDPPVPTPPGPATPQPGAR